jgi:hypothetical protein
VPLRELFERALRAHLEPRRASAQKRYKLRLKVRGGGVQPGATLENWSALRDLMDERG